MAGRVALSLPTAANGLSDERRQQLLARAQMEVSEAENESDVPGVPTPTATERLASYTLLLVCGTAFLSLLLIRLQSGKPSWGRVFIPLLLLSSIDLLRHSYRAFRRWLYDEPVSQWVLLHRLVDTACTLACEVTVLLYLEGTIPSDTSWLLILVPAWVSAVTCTVLLCCTPTPQFLLVSPQSVETYQSSMFVTGAFHFVQTGVQVLLVALKLDGTITSSWATVFIPCWLFLAVSALFYGVTICILCGACCIVVATGDRSSAELRAFVVVWFGQVSMVVSWTVCLFLFLLFLTEKLDGDDDVSAAQVITPLLVLFVVLPLLVPLNHLGAHALQDARATTAADREAAGGAANEEVILEALPAPTALLRQGSTYFRRATSSFVSRLSEGGDAAANGYEDMDGIGTRVDTDFDVEAGSTPTSFAGRIFSSLSGRVSSGGAETSRRQSDAGSRTCYICQTEVSDAVLMECGHGGVCYECGLSLLRKGKHHRCPICRASITQVLRLTPEAAAGGRYNEIVQSAEGVVLQKPVSRRGR